MDAFALLVEELLEDGRAGDGLNHFVNDAAGIIGRDGGVAELEGEVAGPALLDYDFGISIAFMRAYVEP